MWRDGTARFEDESVDYVLPEALLMKFSHGKIETQQGMEIECGEFIPEYVFKYKEEILKIIVESQK